MIQNLIFDVDGTLVDSVDLHARSWQQAFAHFGYPTRFEDVRAQIGKGADQLIPVFVPKQQLARLYDALDQFRSDLFKTKYLDKVRGFPRVRELFLRLRADGKRIALASSARQGELGHYKAIARIQDLVDVETSADEAERSKPCPDIFEAALKKLGDPEPAQCVVIGDTPYDAIGARRARLRTIGLLCGGFPEQALRDAGAAPIYADPAALLEALERAGDAALGP